MPCKGVYGGAHISSQIVVEGCYSLDLHFAITRESYNAREAKAASNSLTPYTKIAR